MFRLLCAVLLLAVPAAADAQWYAPLRADDRIELRIRKGPLPIEGRFVRATNDSLWLRSDQSSLTVPYPVTPLESVRIYRGTKREIGRSALRGLLIGAAVGGSIGFVGGLTDRAFSEFFGGPLGGAAVVGALFAAPGIVIGGLLGISTPVWQPVELPRP